MTPSSGIKWYTSPPFQHFLNMLLGPFKIFQVKYIYIVTQVFIFVHLNVHVLSVTKKKASGCSHYWQYTVHLRI